MAAEVIQRDSTWDCSVIYIHDMIYNKYRLQVTFRTIPRELVITAISIGKTPMPVSAASAHGGAVGAHVATGGRGLRGLVGMAELLVTLG